jgi:hypothetical protein
VKVHRSNFAGYESRASRESPEVVAGDESVVDEVKVHRSSVAEGESTDVQLVQDPACAEQNVERSSLAGSESTQVRRYSGKSSLAEQMKQVA